MHVHTHMAPPPELNTRMQQGKPVEQEPGAYAQVSDQTQGRSKGRQQQPETEKHDPDKRPMPTTSGLLKPRILVPRKPVAPFMAYTCVTEFWAELVMATRETDPVPETAPPVADTSLNDLFAQAMK